MENNGTEAAGAKVWRLLPRRGAASLPFLCPDAGAPASSCLLCLPLDTLILVLCKRGYHPKAGPKQSIPILIISSHNLKTSLTPSSHEPYTLKKCKSSLRGMNYGLMLSIAMATNDIIS